MAITTWNGQAAARQGSGFRRGPVPFSLESDALRVLGVFVVIRVAAVAAHYFGTSPYGGPLVESPLRFVGSAILIELFALGLLAFPFVFLRFTERGAFLLSGLLLFYNFLAQLDLEVRRWMHEPIRVSFLLAYRNSFFAETNFTFLKHQISATILACLWITAPCFYLLLTRKRRGLSFAPTSPPSQTASQRRAVFSGILAVILLALLGTSPMWFMPSKARARRTRPILLSLIEEAKASVTSQGHAQNPSLAARDLKSLVECGRLSSENSATASVSSEFPLLSLSAGRPLPPPEQLPHIFVIVVESYRSWLSGMMPGQEEPPVAPFLERLARDGSRFPLNHAAGFPSVEAAIALHLGLWSHPEKVIAAEYLHVSTLSFPEILRKSGYRARAIFGTEPGFDNLTPWFRRWYDEVHFSPRFYGDDKKLYDYASLLLKDMDVERPQLMTIINSTTHVPYRVPPGSGVTPAPTSAERYRQAMLYFDSQVETFVKTLQQRGLWNRSVVVLVGDHAQPRRTDRARSPWEDFHTGHTWTPLAFTGGWPGLPEPKLFETTTSHVDLAPTLLSLLQIDTLHHFVGRPLLARRGTPQPTLDERPAYALRFGMLLEHTDSTQTLSFFDGTDALTRSRSPSSVREYGLFEEPPKAVPDPSVQEAVARRNDAFLFYGQLFEQDRILPREYLANLPLGRYVYLK